MRSNSSQNFNRPARHEVTGNIIQGVVTFFSSPPAAQNEMAVPGENIIDKLPDEVLIHIFSHTNLLTQAQLKKVSKKCFRLASDPMLVARLTQPARLLEVLCLLEKKHILPFILSCRSKKIELTFKEEIANRKKDGLPIPDDLVLCHALMTADINEIETALLEHAINNKNDEKNLPKQMSALLRGLAVTLIVKENQIKPIISNKNLLIEKAEPGKKEKCIKVRAVLAKLKGNLYVNLSSASLPTYSLNHINFQGVNLENVNLMSAFLCFANFSGCYLRNANLTCAHIKGANFNRAYLYGCQFESCDFKYEDNNLKRSSSFGLPNFQNTILAKLFLSQGNLSQFEDCHILWAGNLLTTLMGHLLDQVDIPFSFQMIFPQKLYYSLKYGKEFESLDSKARQKKMSLTCGVFTFKKLQKAKQVLEDPSFKQLMNQLPSLLTNMFGRGQFNLPNILRLLDYLIDEYPKRNHDDSRCIGNIYIK